MNQNITNALNKQINEEMKSAYLYLAMSADFSDKNLPGFAQWMHVQYQEEMVHAMKIYNYILERGKKVELLEMDKPQSSWNSVEEAFEAAYQHEQFITDCINKLVKLARDESDYATEIFLQWFVSEQVEEEASADEILQNVKMVKESKHGMYMLDKEMSQRQFHDESGEE